VIGVISGEVLISSLYLGSSSFCRFAPSGLLTASSAALYLGALM
jgi:hypothetical protein